MTTTEKVKPAKSWKHGRCARCPYSEKDNGSLYCSKFEKPAARVAWNCKKVV